MWPQYGTLYQQRVGVEQETPLNPLDMRQAIARNVTKVQSAL